MIQSTVLERYNEESDTEETGYTGTFMVEENTESVLEADL
jgi:hypothetical protein